MKIFADMYSKFRWRAKESTLSKRRSVVDNSNIVYMNVHQVTMTMKGRKEEYISVLEAELL